MMRFLLVAAFASLLLPLPLGAEWYVPDGAEARLARIEGGELITRLAVRAIDVKVTSVTLRHHRGNLGKYVLDAAVEPGGRRAEPYILAVGDTIIDDIKTADNACTIGFDSISLARTCLKHLRELHHLDADHARDETFQRPPVSDVHFSKLDRSVRNTEMLFWGEQSTVKRFSARVRELTQAADSLFEEDVKSDLGYLEAQCGQIQEIAKRILPLFTPPPRSRQATNRLIKNSLDLLELIHRVHARSAIIEAKLRTHFKARKAEKPFELLRFDASLLKDAALGYHEGISSFLLEEL